MSEGGKKLLKDLASKVREKTTPTGEPILNARGLALVDELGKELTGEGAMPGLHLFRDTPAKFRLQREKKNAELTIDWQRPIGALVLTGVALGHTKFTHNYVWDETEQRWRRLDSLGEIWEDLSTALVDLLYPEGK